MWKVPRNSFAFSGQSRFLRWLSPLPAFIRDEFFVLPIPQRLVISSRRLGLLLRILQLLLVIAVLSYCFFTKVWLADFTPKLWTSEVRQVPGNVSGMANQLVQHCQDPQSFRHSRQSEGTMTQVVPTHCVRLLGEAHSSNSNGITVPTFITQQTVWTGMGSACLPVVAQWCANRSIHALYNGSGGTCDCKWAEAFFPMNPEEDEIRVTHGYEVELGGHIVVREKSSIEGVLYGTPPDLKRVPGQLLTKLLRADGSPCKLGGRSEWKQSESANGITGLLREWLACAGIPSLDADPHSLEAGVQGDEPHIRTMGIWLRLYLDYQNYHGEGHAGTICYMTISRLVQGSALPATYQTINLPALAGDGSVETSTSTVMYGVSFTLEATGVYKVRDMWSVYRTVIDMLVLWQVPFYVMQFIALYCLGFISELYRRARRTKFDLIDQFPNAVCRSMLALMGFRGLVGGQFGDRASRLPALSQRGLADSLIDLFHENIKAGTMSESELKCIAMVTFQHLDTLEKGGITSTDFIRSVMAHDIIDLQHITRFFARREPSGKLQQVLDDCGQQFNMELQRVECDPETLQQDPTMRLRRSMQQQETSLMDVVKRLDALEEVSLRKSEEGVIPDGEQEEPEASPETGNTRKSLTVVAQPCSVSLIQAAVAELRIELWAELRQLSSTMETRECMAQEQLLRLEISVEQSRQQQKAEMEELAKHLQVTKQAPGAMQEVLPAEVASGIEGFRGELANFTHEARSMLEALNRRCCRLEEKLLQSALTTSQTSALPHLTRALEQEPVPAAPHAPMPGLRRACDPNSNNGRSLSWGPQVKGPSATLLGDTLTPVSSARRTIIPPSEKLPSQQVLSLSLSRYQV